MSSMRAGCVLCCYAHNLSRPVVALILVYFKFSILILRFFLVTQARHSTALTTCRHVECQHDREKQNQPKIRRSDWTAPLTYSFLFSCQTVKNYVFGYFGIFLEN
jgi:hypothetical protein